jgi:hypothetical protein
MNGPVPSRYRRKHNPVPDLRVRTTELEACNVLQSASSLSSAGSASASASSWSSSPLPNTGFINITIKLPTQTVTKQLLITQQVSDVLRELVSEHRYELGPDPDDFMLWEVDDDSRRPLRSQEYLKHITTSWGFVDACRYYLEVTKSSLRLDVSSLAFLTPRRDLLKDPRFSGTFQWGNDFQWRKSGVEIKNGVLSIFCGTYSRTLQLNEFDIYEGIPGPNPYTFTVKSQQSPEYFIKPSDGVHYFSTHNKQDYDLLKNIIFSLRSQAVDKLVRQYADALEDPQKMLSQVPSQPLLSGGAISPASPNTSTMHSGRSVRSSPVFNSDGLLGKSYSPSHCHSLKPVKVAPPSPSSIRFTPNSLLAKPVSLSNGSMSARDSDSSRGLLGSAYAKKQLPKHTIAVTHRPI